MTRALALALVAVGCTPRSTPAYDVALEVIPITDVRLPLRTPGAAGAWTSRGFLLISAGGAASGDEREPLAEDPTRDLSRRPPRKEAFLYSPQSGELTPLPGAGPPDGMFEGAAPLDGGAVILTHSGGWFVDVDRGEWMRLEGGPVGRLQLQAYSARPGALLLYGLEGSTCAAWELSERGRRWVRLPPPPCGAYVRLASDAHRWWIFVDDAGRMRGASLERGAARWGDSPERGAPAVFGGAVAGDGWVVLQGIRTFPLLWVVAAGREGLFTLRDSHWAVFDALADEECGWELRELRGDVLFAMGSGRRACAWDLRQQRRLIAIDAPSFDSYLHGDGVTLGWGHTLRAAPRPVDPSPRPVYSGAAALIRWRAFARAGPR